MRKITVDTSKCCTMDTDDFKNRIPVLIIVPPDGVIQSTWTASTLSQATMILVI